MQATMELVNKGEYISWKLPKNTQIILTSNPDDGNYSVSSMDAAMESRFLSFNIDFDINPWALWAESVGVGSTWINFALFTPEIFTRSLRINPRSFTMFANACNSLKNLEDPKSLDMINLLSKGAFGEDGDYIGGMVVQFINNRLDKLVSAEYILLHDKFDEVFAKLKETCFQGENYRADIAAVLTIRVCNFIELKADKDNAKKIAKRLENFFNIDETVLTEDLLLKIVAKMNSKFTKECTTLLMNKKVFGKILG